MSYRRTPILLLPFAAVWKLVEFILKMTGRFVAAILGLVLMLVGGLLCVTVVGAVVGIPLCAFGFAMVIRGFF